MTTKISQDLLIKNLIEQSTISFEKIETHISTLILDQQFVWKIKKPVDFGFLDFSTLYQRDLYCHEEIRLNQRLAPDVYIGVSTINGSVTCPVIDGDGPILDYAVKMRRFEDAGLFDHMLQKSRLTAELITSLAQQIADFHKDIAVSESGTEYGSLQSIQSPMFENFRQIRQALPVNDSAGQLNELELWTQQQLERLKPVIKQRKQDGFIRECHGDMHLGNITLDQQRIIIFDGIEFNPNLRWIDTISEIAFITMDLIEKGATDLSTLLLNRYLEHTGDYEGMRLLRLYQVYRAMVRAKVAALSMDPNATDDPFNQKQMATVHKYLDVASTLAKTTSPQIWLMSGYSATGKSTVSESLMQHLFFIRLRSDRERKRLFEKTQNSAESINEGIYSQQATDLTYQRLLELSSLIIHAGINVLIDATFLKQSQRQLFHQLASEMQVTCKTVWLDASETTLIQRMKKRWSHSQNISDADESVIRYQLDNAEVPPPGLYTKMISTEQPIDYQDMLEFFEQ